MRSTTRSSEQGFTVVLVAMTIVVMATSAAFAIDLGQAYTGRRQMQNAADAASLAGTRTLLKVRDSVTGAFLDPTGSVWSTVRDTAVQNGADSTQVTCNIIRRDGSTIAPCSPAAGWILDGLLGGPAGVMVTTAATFQTSFARIIGRQTLTSRTSASARIEPLISSKGAPFIICGNLLKGGYDILSLTGTIKPTSIGMTISLQSSQQPDCGGGSTFKGKTADDGTGFALGGWLAGSTGNGNDHSTYDTVAGATPCVPPTFTNCDLVLPIADNGVAGPSMHVVALGVFHVTGNGLSNPKYFGTLLSASAPVTRGQGGSGNCSPGAACLIKLAS